MTDTEQLIFHIIRVVMLIPLIILLLDIARLSIFIFYDKHENRLPKKRMLEPLVGNKLFSIKNLLIACIVLPSVYLCYYIAFNFHKIAINFIIGYYAIALIVVVILFASSIIGKKIQVNVNTRAAAKKIFAIEIILLLLVTTLVLMLPD